MKNKHGFLLGEETVKIIIAVICLVALVYFLASLYLANRNKDLELAKASLEKLIADINAGRNETEIYNPKGWLITSFSSSKEIIPKYCLDKEWENCICICVKPASTGGNVHFAVNGCDNKGVCQETGFITLDIIEITPPVFLSINQDTKIITKK